MHPLGLLPGELYFAVFEELPEEDVQYTVLSLTRVFPHAAIPLYHLYHRLRVGTAEQAIALNRHLRTLIRQQRAAKDDSFHSPLAWIQHLSAESWTVDADVMLNVVALLPQLKTLNVWIGPSNFSPEHLEEMFEEPFGNLEYLGLRFRPYVQKATYYQFLKGAYFDSTLLALSRWPPHRLPALSIVQDPFKIDPSLQSPPGTRQAFAQPIVFFRFENSLSVLLQSPAFSQSLNAFRLRVPFRPIARSLCSPPLFSNSSDGLPTHGPSLDIMDLSTSGVLEGEVDLLLVHYKDLKHLVLDDCSILRGDHREGEWAAMGKRCAMAGARRAKECEKALTAWYEQRVLAAPVGSDGAPAAMPSQTRRPRRGRRGLATATISLRSRTPPRPGPGGPPSALIASPREALPKFKVLPPMPSLRTLCATPSASVPPATYATIRSEFEAGWAEGVAQLAVRRARLRESARLGTKILRFTAGNEAAEPPDGPDLNGFFTYAASHGLELIDSLDMSAFDTFGRASGDPKDIPIPVLCLSGNRNDMAHVEDCGHLVVDSTWPRL